MTLNCRFHRSAARLAGLRVSIAQLVVAGGFSAASLLAAPSASIIGITQVQAVMEIRGASGTCAIDLSESPGFSPPTPDMDGARYPNANTDQGRPDTFEKSGGIRIVTLGHITDDRALKAVTQYYWRVRDCGETVSGTFTTRNLGYGNTRTEATPFNSSNWGNLGLPRFDWSADKTYTDPLTGVVLKPISRDFWTWRTGGGGPTLLPGSIAFDHWTGGSGWTNANEILQGAGSAAKTNNTNPVDLYANLSGPTDPVPYDTHRMLGDLGVVVWGQGSGADPADRTIDLCVFHNPVQGCVSKTIQVILPAGRVAAVRSGSKDPDQAWPAAFPSMAFQGWINPGDLPLIRNENLTTSGTAEANGRRVTIAMPTVNQHWSNALQPGARILMEGSNCPNGLCTLDALESPGVAVLAEEPGNGAKKFRAFGWGIRVWKHNSSGAVTVGLKYKMAGVNAPLGVQSLGDKCSSVMVTSGDGKQGYVCQLTSIIAGVGALAFIANDGTARVISHRFNVGFDPALGNVFYQGGTNASGGRTILRLTYRGDFTRAIDYHFTCSSSGACPTVDDEITATDIMPASSKSDLGQQILAKQGQSLPAYNAALYGDWTSSARNVSYAGSSGHYGFFANVYAGQDGGPGWVAVVDLSTNPASVVRLIHTIDGTGLASARYGSFHSGQAMDNVPNVLNLSMNLLQAKNPNVPHGGPYQATPTGKWAGGAWSTDTKLPWPPDGSYDRNCQGLAPANADCVTLRFPAGGVCNVAPHATEKMLWPCPWNAGYSQYPPMAADDNFVDLAVFGGFDSEHFKILSISKEPDGQARVLLQRNAVYDYCGIGRPMSVQAPSQLLHADGWTATVTPGRIGCGSAFVLQEQSTGQVEELGRSFMSHGSFGSTELGVNLVSATNGMHDIPFDKIGSQPPVYFSFGTPKFHGVISDIGGPAVQSYVSVSYAAKAARENPWALDMNPVVGCQAEVVNCGIPRTLTRVAADIYRVQVVGSAPATLANYKINTLQGWAGRYQLRDVSAARSGVAGKPYSMCFVAVAGECHPGSAANEVYINVPQVLDAGICQPGITWANVPCVAIGWNAPAGGIRQFKISESDREGRNTRFVANAYSSVGRHYPFSHANVHPSGKWGILMSPNIVDGFGFPGWLFSIPPWQESAASNSDFQGYDVQVSAGQRFADVQFGYSRYGLPNQFFCSPRGEACSASGALYRFESEPENPVSCANGCKIRIPAVAPNITYFRIRRSIDGKTWTPGETEVIAVQ